MAVRKNSKQNKFQRLIPTIYFYIMSAVGMVIFIIGLFNTFHFVTGVVFYEKYPLYVGAETQCDFRPNPVDIKNLAQSKEECLKSLEEQRTHQKTDDLEKAISFTTIGLLVYLIHFTFARKSRIS